MTKTRQEAPDGVFSLHKAAGHLKTINAHKWEVMKGCFKIGLYRQGLMHDLSKYSPTEFIEGCLYYQEGRRSPNNGERESKGYSEAWMHHKGRNRHHYEYWNDYRLPGGGEDSFPVTAVRMPRKYVAEMLMDRIAASKTYQKENYTQHGPLQYLQNGRGRKLMDPETYRELEIMLKILDERGEEELIRFVKDYYLKGFPMESRKKKKEREEQC